MTNIKPAISPAPATSTPGQKQAPAKPNPTQPWTDRNAAAFPNTVLKDQDGNVIRKGGSNE